MRGFAHRQRMQQQGVRREDVMERPMVAIINTWSDLSPCHAHLRERAEAVKRGILLAGGIPGRAAGHEPGRGDGQAHHHAVPQLPGHGGRGAAAQPARATAWCCWRGCDKTTPGTVMGAISMDIPTLFCPAGPMLNDRYVKNGVAARSAPARTPACSGTTTRPAISSADEWVHLEVAHDPRTGHLQHHGHGHPP
ncbi:MAG: dihydroxy-acid dehydratase [Candidatus Nanopelagicales bacterium]